MARSFAPAAASVGPAGLANRARPAAQEEEEETSKTPSASAVRNKKVFIA
jgi:hypothetical protein